MNRVDLEKHAKEATQKEESTDEKNIINNNGLKLDEDKSIIEETQSGEILEKINEFMPTDSNQKGGCQVKEEVEIQETNNLSTLRWEDFENCVDNNGRQSEGGRNSFAKGTAITPNRYQQEGYENSAQMNKIINQLQEDTIKEDNNIIKQSDADAQRSSKGSNLLMNTTETEELINSQARDSRSKSSSGQQVRFEDDQNEQFTDKGLSGENDNDEASVSVRLVPKSFQEESLTSDDDDRLQQNCDTRQKQRYFSESGANKTTVVRAERPGQDKVQNNDEYSENGISSSVSLFMKNTNQEVEQLDQQDQDLMNQSVSDSIDFFSSRPPTGYFQMRRGASGNYQVTDLIQEHNKLKEQQKKQLKRDQFMIEFNTDPNQAIKKLEEDQHLSLSNISEFLAKAEGIRKNTLGQFFGKDNPKNQAILKEFCHIIDFKGRTIDEALRQLMQKFRLPGESQQIDRIMCAFSDSFFEQNPTVFANSDIVYILAFSIMMLHTDAHSDKIEKKDKMKKEVFIERTLSVTKNPTLTGQMLSDIYDRIQAKQFECAQDAFEKAYDLLLISSCDIQSDYAKKFVQDVKYFRNGSIFIKYGRQGSPKEKFVYLSEKEDQICWCNPKTKGQHREILIEDIYEITIGCDTTEVMKRNKVPKQLNNLCFSLNIIGHDNGKRSLDLQAKDEDQRNKWVRFCYQKLLNAKQQAFELKKAKFDQQEYKEEIVNIWKNQIFDQFDKYWDYEHNKALHMDKFQKYKSAKKELTSQNVWKNVFKRKKQTKYSQVSVLSEAEGVHEHLEELLKDKELLFIRLWKQGLPHFVRKTLYRLSIGNKMEISENFFRIIKEQTEEFLKKNLSSQNTKETNNRTSEEIKEDGMINKQEELLGKIVQMRGDLQEFVAKNAIFQPNQATIERVLCYTLCHRQELNYIHGMVSIAALMVNIFQNECESFTYFLNFIFSNHFKPLYASDKIKVEYFNQFFYKSFQKEMKDLHERFEGLNLGPQNYLFGWLLSFFSDYFVDFNIVNRIFDNFLLEGEVYVFKAALGIIKMYEIDLRFSSFSVALKYLTEPSSNVNEEFLFDTIECINIHNEDYLKYFEDLKKSQVKSLIHEILVEI